MGLFGFFPWKTLAAVSPVVMETFKTVFSTMAEHRHVEEVKKKLQEMELRHKALERTVRLLFIGLAVTFAVSIVALCMMIGR